MYKLYSSGTKLFLFSIICNDTTSVLFKENVSTLVFNSYGLALDTPYDTPLNTPPSHGRPSWYSFKLGTAAVWYSGTCLTKAIGLPWMGSSDSDTTPDVLQSDFILFLSQCYSSDR